MTHKKKKAPSNNTPSHTRNSQRNKQQQSSGNQRSNNKNNNNDSCNSSFDDAENGVTTTPHQNSLEVCKIPGSSSVELCDHYDRSINISSFRKSINHLQSIQCSKRAANSSKSTNTTSSSNTTSTESHCASPVSNCLLENLFACTLCGTVVCLKQLTEEEPDWEETENPSSKRSSKYSSHAHEHFLTPRTDCHALFLQLKGEVLYCIPCEQKLPVHGNKIMALNSLIKKAKSCWPSDLLESLQLKTPTDAYTKCDPSSSSSKSQNRQGSEKGNNRPGSHKSHGGTSVSNNSLSIRREIRGFSNLGNTCFFNSVVQNLMQTVWLRQVLNKLSTNRTLSIDCDNKLKLNSLGDMTDSLNQLYNVYFNGAGTAGAQNGSMNPKMLFQSLCQFCPMFKSREQQDSQEMFSCLINALFEEDEKRVKDAIMEKYGMPNGTKCAKKLDDMTKASIKREWKQAQRLNTVSAIFGGMLTKYIKCNHCSNINCKSEPFISLSLSLSGGGGGASGSTVVGSNAHSNSTGLFSATRKPNSNSLSKDDKNQDSSSNNISIAFNNNPQSEAAIQLKRRKALSENKPPPEVTMPIKCKINTKVESGAVQREKAPEVPTVKVKDEAVDEGEQYDENDPFLMMGEDLFGDIFDNDESKKDNERPLTTVSVEIPKVQNNQSNYLSNPINISSVGGDKNSLESEEQPVKKSYDEQLSLDLSNMGLDCEKDSVRPVKEDPDCDSLITEKSSMRQFSFCSSVSSTSEMKVGSNKSGGCGSTTSGASACDSAYASQTSLLTNGPNNSSEVSSITGCSNFTTESPSACSPRSVGTENVSNVTENSTYVNGNDVVSSETASSSKTGPDGVDKTTGVFEECTDNDDAASSDTSSLGLDDLFAVSATENESLLNSSKQENKGEKDNCAQNGSQPLSANLNNHSSSSKNSNKTAVDAVSNNSTASNSFALPDSLANPLEALYMSTLSDGVYQPKENELSVMSLMKSFINLEYLTGCNKIKCDKCSVNDNRNLSDACVWYRITSSPSVLVLHIKRFAQFGLRLKKLNTFVTIQPVLDIGPFCSADCPIESKSTDKNKNRILYKLYGIVEHVGSLHSGHYTAYVCQKSSSSSPPEPTDIVSSLLERLSDEDEKKKSSKPEGDQSTNEEHNGERSPGTNEGAPPNKNNVLNNNVWYHISDSAVKQVPLSKVLNSSPYMLFYEKIIS